MSRYLLVLLLVCAFATAQAQQTPIGDSADLQASPTAATSGDWLDQWLDRVSKIQSEQPHWVTPLVTVTPRLEQEFRFDVTRQIQPNLKHQWNLGYGKGLEIIPFDRVEIIIGEPNYIIHNSPAAKDGFADETFLLKYRIAARNETKGNWIVSAFLGGSLPTGSYKNGSTDASVTPTIAAGKGFGDFSVQTTLGAQLPVRNSLVIGKTLAWNTAFQYRVMKKIWPELEINENHFLDGPAARSGKTQVFVTPGVVIGRLPIHDRTAFTFGVGEQIATSEYHTYNHNAVLSLRVPF